MVTAGYQVTDHFKVTVGYDLLYWTAVVRAADQIAVEPTTGYPYGTVVGNYATLPAFSFNESHYPGRGLASGRRGAVLSWHRVYTKKGQGTSVSPALFSFQNRMSAQPANAAR